MKKWIAALGVVAVVALGLWVATGASACYTCVGTFCEDFGRGYVDCSEWENPNGGSGCVAGGGTCRPVM